MRHVRRADARRNKRSHRASQVTQRPIAAKVHRPAGPTERQELLPSASPSVIGAHFPMSLSRPGAGQSHKGQGVAVLTMSCRQFMKRGCVGPEPDSQAVALRAHTDTAVSPEAIIAGVV